ncbi:MAG: GDSL-type esterase/lipase family protein [Clostridiales bacterium]|jgi:lysophospholipase L1-like esterase|nr:GDSL-type esterase/lipase family protein [Clostridiales bacterium]
MEKAVKKGRKAAVIIIAAVSVFVLGGFAAYELIWGYTGRLINAEAKLKYWKDRGFAEGEILLAGSSFIEYWETSEADLQPLVTYNVGVAGTVVSDWDKYVDKLITPFRPRAILLYVGSNDIHGGVGSKKGETVAGEVEKLFEKIHQKLPGTAIYYISIAPTPLRKNVWAEADKSNKLVAAYCAERFYLNFFDCTAALLNEDGGLKTEIYRSDRLHFNEKGYAIWTDVIAPVLISVILDDHACGSNAEL